MEVNLLLGLNQCIGMLTAKWTLAHMKTANVKKGQSGSRYLLKGGTIFTNSIKLLRFLVLHKHFDSNNTGHSMVCMELKILGMHGVFP
jgi:hypothetical protein